MTTAHATTPLVDPEARPVLSVAEAAQLLGVGQWLLLQRADLDAFVAAGRVEAQRRGPISPPSKCGEQ